MNQPHGFEAVHARHEDVEKQQIEISGIKRREPLAATTGDDDAVTGPFQRKPDGAVPSANREADLYKNPAIDPRRACSGWIAREMT